MTVNVLTNTTVSATEQFVTKLLSKELSKDLKYHNLQHTIAVRDAGVAIAQALNLPEEEVEIIELACLFHDTGFTETYNGHESVSQRIAKQFLQEQKYPTNKLQQVLQCINVTTHTAHPTNLMEQVIKDADYVNLSSANYLESIEALRHEWSHYLNQDYNDEAWMRLNYDFLKVHQYFTPVARQLLEPQKIINLKELKKIVKKGKREKKQPEGEGGEEEMSVAISESKSASMMFKTSLRNHLDLSNLADNKANIMLSVNALIITVAIPTVSSYAQNVPFVIYPMAVLIASCLISMIFATLATRPIKMTGMTDPSVIKSGESNLFFFGNFYSMTFPEYQKGMQQVMSDEKDLDGAIMRDLFFLGRSLGKKYTQLRVCYNIFMVGVVVTVVVYGVCYAIFN